VRELATPREGTVVTNAKLQIIKARLASGYTQAEVAASLGIPVSTLNTAIHK
jgi:DNA-binding CsgD family transcriptional regulator